MKSLPLLILLLLPWASRADEITLEGGLVVEGRVEPRPEGKVLVRVGETSLLVPAGRVLKVVPAPLPEEVYVQRLREDPPATPAGHRELARWCRAKGLQSKASHHWTEALRLDPGCEEALLALGYRKVDGIWMSVQDLAELRKREEAKKEAKKEAGKGNGKLLSEERVKVRVKVPMVTLEMRPTLSQLQSFRTVPAVGGVGGLAIEAPTVRLSSLRTTVQVPGGP